jgi:pimeloyl-ACP methyl ester carboxylesterase
MKRWFLRGFYLLAVLLMLALACGAAWEAVKHSSEATRFPPRGQLVDIGGYKLDLNCTGSGSPAVILETGLGVPSVSWDQVQRQVSGFARVCSYDRAGYGYSDAGPAPRTSLRIATELHTLLHNGGVTGPLVLVGHSFGGFNVRVFTGQFPSEVVGMVLVDSSHEDQNAHIPAKLAAQARAQTRWAPILPLLRPIGVIRYMIQQQPGTSEETIALEMRPNFLGTSVQELAEFEESANQVRAAGNLGDRPLIVLTAGKTVPVPAELQPDITAFRKIWVDELQPSLAHLSTQGKRVMVMDSDHMIPLEDPQAIVTAIGEVVSMAAHSHI